jgi:pimeloyl-ACP methyl ester carboxylesterase
MAGDPISRADEIAAPFVGEAWYRAAFGDGPISARWSDLWWRWVGENFAISPVPFLERLDLPVLWFLAEDDENVPLVPSWIALRAAFAASPGEDETLVVIPDANHAFLVEEPDGGLHYARGFFERKRAWLAERGMSREGCFESPGRPGPG